MNLKQYYLKSLITQNFRNLNSKKIEFSKGINCVFGENGNGKTNLLEAIHILTNKKSFRKNTSFAQYLSTDYLQPETILMSELLDFDDNLIKYNISHKTQANQVYIDGIKSKRYLKLNSVFVNPFDSYQFHHTSTFRRDLLDQFMRKVSVEYKSAHNDYKKSLKFRNELLSKKPSYLHAQLDAIEKELAKTSQLITNYRLSFLSSLNPYLSKTFKKIFFESHELSLELEKNMHAQSENDYINSFKNSRERELVMGRTLNGVHRDNYTFFFDGMNSFEYCSLGQQKMSYFSLIFAYIELFRYNSKGVYPIVLLDDVSGELDEKRWKYLIEYLEQKRFQVFITTANEGFQKELERIENSKKIVICEGEINPQE